MDLGKERFQKERIKVEKVNIVVIFIWEKFHVPVKYARLRIKVIDLTAKKANAETCNLGRNTTILLLRLFFCKLCRSSVPTEVSLDYQKS